MATHKRIGRPLKEHPPGATLPLTIQIPTELKAWVQARAVENNRTLSQEIVLVLSEAKEGFMKPLARQFGDGPTKKALALAIALSLIEQGKAAGRHMRLSWRQSELDAMQADLDLIREHAMIIDKGKSQ